MTSKAQQQILIHYGEVALKGKNQPRFRRMLQRNIHQMLKYNGFQATVRQTRGYLSVGLEQIAQNDHPRVLDLIKNVFGIIWYTLAFRIPYQIPIESHFSEIHKQITRALLLYTDGITDLQKSYAVRVKRSDKRFPLKSVAYERELGTFIREHTGLSKVDLENPDHTFYIEVQAGEIYVYSEKLPGYQGLPVGSAGRVLTMLSGGIDSPVAAFLIAKRGCKVDFIHFTASHITREQALREKISRLSSELSRYTIRSKLFLVPYTYFQLAVIDKKIRFELVLFRRFMIRVAQKIASMSKSRGLVTGDNLSQVASQTLWNLASVTPIATCPVLQPLITYEKHEIIDIARRINTYDISIEPYKDCCSLISRNPNTASRSEELDRLEREIFPDYRGVIANSINDMIRLEFYLGSLCE